MEKTKWVLPSVELSPLNKRVIKMDTAMGVMETMQGEETLIALSLSAKALKQCESDLTDALELLDRCSDAFAELSKHLGIEHIRAYNETDNFISKFKPHPPMTNRIDDFPKSGKIKVTPEESRIVQERLFKEGYRWKGGDDLLSHPHNHIILWNGATKRIGWLLGDMLFAFSQHSNPEYTMDLFEPKQSEGDEWEEAYEAFSKTDSYRYCPAINVSAMFLKYLKSNNYKLTKL